ncbi:Uncharacterised protein [Moellerella wisconsensis]|nr:Uncharacterised protein [Moellerella wisconsensis]
MNLTPEQLEEVIQKAVEKAITRSFIKYLKFTIGIPVILIIVLGVFALLVRQ